MTEYVPGDVERPVVPVGQRPDNVAPSLGAWLAAHVLKGRLDRQLAVGVFGSPGSALAMHAARITATDEREAIARALRTAIKDAIDPPFSRLTPRIPVHRSNVLSAETTIDKVTLRLHSPRPVSARGMARLRLLLSDGLGPFYEDGRGDLEGRLGAAFAAL